MKDGTHLRGLEGTNPLGFLAALGVQVLFDFEECQPKLWWSDDVIPHAIVNPEFDIDRIVTQAMQEFPRWLESPALNPRIDKKADNDAKFKPDDLKQYLSNAQASHPGNRLASALVAQGSYDNNGNAKPSDLYLSAGRVAFLRDARKILQNVTNKHLEGALQGPWIYDSDLPSLRWDIIDDPNYALAAVKPGVNKLTCPGPEALALLGFSIFPVFGSPGRTLTQGCSGSWKNGLFAWPLWTTPAERGAIKSLLAHVSNTEPVFKNRSPWYGAWHISHIVQSSIRRNDAAMGLGNMAPPHITNTKDLYD